jgi:DnaJ-class molecular chaperone
MKLKDAICPLCRGSGETEILTNPHDESSDAATFTGCPGCSGKGLLGLGRAEDYPCTSAQALAAATKAVDKEFRRLRK